MQQQMANFRATRDFQGAFNAAMELCAPALTNVSRVLGHLDGVGSDMRLAPPTEAVLKSAGLWEIVQRMARIYADMWKSFGSWANAGAYDQLKRALVGALQTCGIGVGREGQNLVVHFLRPRQ